MEIRGYKAFNKDMTNRYGVSFLENTKYEIDGKASFGNDGNGFHFCTRLEDTLRYFDAINGNIQIAEVVGRGDMVSYNDEYYGYYDMYSATELEVVRVLSREEIVGMFMEGQIPSRVIRFVQGYKLSDEEKELFRINYSSDIGVLKHIDYYQDDNKDAFADKGKVYSKSNGGRKYE